MPDGNAPSRSPSAPDEARAPSSQVPVPPVPKPAAPVAPAPKLRAVRGGASAASQPAPAPASQLTRLETLRKQLIEARFSGLPLTELLKTYDKEVFAITVATQKNGGLSPLSAKEEAELQRVEEARGALAEAREDDPRARAKAIAEQLKRAKQGNAKLSANQTAALEARQEATNTPSPAPASPTINLRALRQELKLLQEEAWTNGLTRELDRTPGASINDLEKALEQAEQAEQAAHATPKQPPVTQEATLDETPVTPDATTPSTDSETALAASVGAATTAATIAASAEQAEEMVGAHAERLEALANATEAQANHLAITREAITETLTRLGQAPEIRIVGEFSSDEERKPLTEIDQNLAYRQTKLLETLQKLRAAQATIDTLPKEERDTLLHDLEQVQEKTAFSSTEEHLTEERLAEIEQRYTKLVAWLESGRNAERAEAYSRALLPLRERRERVTTNSAPAVSSEQAIIDEARAELRATYATRQREQAILTTYRTRIAERSWSYLQTHEPAQFQRLQSIQTQLNIQIDPSTTLTSGELEPLHLQAVADTRAEFPDLTDAVLSALLLKQAGASLAGAAAIQAAGNAAALDAALGAATVGAAATAGIVAAGITGAGLIAGHALQQREAEQAVQELAQEEAQIKTRTVQLVQAPTSEISQAGTDLRQAQQTSMGKRRGLQAKLGVRLQQLDAWNATLKVGGVNGVSNTSSTSGLSPASLGMLAIVSPKTLKRATIRPETKPTPSSDSPSDTLKPKNTTQRLRREDSPDEHQKAAHLDSVRARTKVALPSMGGSSRASSAPASSPSSSFASSEEAPLLALSPAPKTREEAFARRQTLMNRTRDQFSGAGASSGGYEAMFGLAPLAATDTDADQDGAALNNGSLTKDEDLDAVTQDFLDEQIREAELRRRQQLDTQRDDQGDASGEGGGKSGMVNKQNIQRAQQAANALRTGAAGTAGVVLAAVLVVVLIIWLNIRLFFPNPESSWRKPLGAFGKIGTVVMDFLVFTFALTQFLMVVATLLIPLAIVALPGAIIAATLMRVLGN